MTPNSGIYKTPSGLRAPPNIRALILYIFLNNSIVISSKSLLRLPSLAISRSSIYESGNLVFCKKIAFCSSITLSRSSSVKFNFGIEKSQILSSNLNSIRKPNNLKPSISDKNISSGSWKPLFLISETKFLNEIVDINNFTILARRDLM